jgi:RNA polymerase sigma-70 factor (ECF subfamily)
MRNTFGKNLDLDEIIERCKSSDRRAQELLFRHLYGKMLAVCMRYISDKDSAQEVVQEGFIKVFENVKGYNSQGSFEGWVRRIMANTAIDAIRKKKKDPYLSDDDRDFKVIPEEENGEEEWEITSLKASYALEAIEQLSPAYRTVFNLYVMENYTHKEIAALLGINEGTSKSNLAKAKMNLQTYLKRKFIQIPS